MCDHLLCLTLCWKEAVDDGNDEDDDEDEDAQAGDRGDGQYLYISVEHLWSLGRLYLWTEHGGFEVPQLYQLGRNPLM